MYLRELTGLLDCKYHKTYRCKMIYFYRKKANKNSNSCEMELNLEKLFHEINSKLSHDKRLRRVYMENRVLQVYFLFAARANAISMSSLTSCSVNGAAHSWELKSGVRFASFRAWVMMSVYLVFFASGLMIVRSGFQLSWKCGRSHFQRSNPQSIPYFFAMSATIRHCFESDG